MADISVDIVTPEGTVFHGDASEVRVCGFQGEFGVLPGHTQYLSALRAGLATLKTASGVKRFILGRGFAEVGHSHVVLLTDLCEDPADVDKSEAQAALRDSMERRASHAVGSEAWKIADRDAELANARLSA